MELPAFFEQSREQIKQIGARLAEEEERLAGISVETEKLRAQMLAHLTQRQEEFKEEMAQQRDTLQKEQEALQQEKETMAAHIKTDGIVDLNVGGQHFTTSLATLTSRPDTLLEAMFTRWELPKDKDGRVFIDRSPQHFSAILEGHKLFKILFHALPRVSRRQPEHFSLEPLVFGCFHLGGTGW